MVAWLKRCSRSDWVASPTQPPRQLCFWPFSISFSAAMLLEKRPWNMNSIQTLKIKWGDSQQEGMSFNFPQIYLVPYSFPTHRSLFKRYPRSSSFSSGFVALLSLLSKPLHPWEATEHLKTQKQDFAIDNI